MAATLRTRTTSEYPPFLHENGSASCQTTAALMTLSGGQNSLLDSDGSVRAIYARAVDHETDPSGEAGIG